MTNVERALYLVLMVWAVIWLRVRRSVWTVIHGAVAAWGVGARMPLLRPTPAIFLES